MKKNTIDFVYEEINFHLPNENLISAWIKKTVNREQKKIEQITFIFCNDEYLLNINIKFLNHDYYTDVITFPYQQKHNPIWGDIFISLDRVKENASIQKVDFMQELYRIMIHGVLHLVGFNDLTELDKKTMNLKENYHLERLRS